MNDQSFRHRSRAATDELSAARTSGHGGGPGLRGWLAHVFMIAKELALLSVQFFRMEALAFDLLPDLADLDLGFMYGSHLMGAIWLMVVVLLSYAAWECAIRLQERGEASSAALRIGTLLIWIFNLGAMVFEFVLFRMLVDDLGNQGLGFTGAAELFGLLMVFTHQMASFWITRNVIREMFLKDATPTATGDRT